MIYSSGSRPSRFEIARWAILVAIFAIASGSGGNLARGAPIILSESFQPVLWGPSASSSFFDQFSVSMSSTGGSSDQQFLNVVRSDGTWLIQNLPVGYEPGTSTLATTFDSRLFASGGAYQTTLSQTAVNSAPVFTSGTAANLGGPVNYMANDPHGITEAGTFNGPGLPSNLALGFGALAGFSYHVGVPDLAQGPNQCGPTSAADSMSWLNGAYHLGLTQTTAQIRDQLATLMKTDPATGTTDDNFLTGKQSFANKLGVNTHVIAGTTFSSILAELQKGQDVELGVSWVGGGGHWIDLVGAIDLGPLGHGIWYNDPDDGQTQTVFSWLDDAGNGMFHVRSLGQNTADIAVAESVPEPSSLAMVAIAGAIGLAFARTRLGRAVA